MTGPLEGRSALVTGAGSGIGRATARLLAARGARVIAADRSERVLETASDHGGITAMIADAGDERDVEAMVARGVAHHGRLDILVANAGVDGGIGGLFEQDAATWEQVLRVNLIGAFLAVKHGARAMLDGGHAGAIVCTASVAGLRSGAGGPAYSASKAGVINLVTVAAQQLSGSGIRVNAVCPGLVETGMTQFIFDAARERGREDRVGQINPLRRAAQPEELAQVIAFLASDEASYVNGQAVAVDGGLSSSLPVSRPPVIGETRF
ncbi:oxidoreductase [Sphingomonas sp. Root710]|uniref:SDR family NAD(P)-dependent oxidoreductase n=1 Tax=Sphingomonas sp. Root710 TaxID=1736594 RepID=UPI0006FB09D7|nr:SDR family NAD(P)-dependent oxidoreductase [Sphingomonas sp. Root710]KRB86383.1 oxidoreductase [Sphingomonas sp. Root710]